MAGLCYMGTIMLKYEITEFEDHFRQIILPGSIRFFHGAGL